MIEVRRSKMKVILTVCIVALVVAIGVAVFFFVRYNNIRNNPESVSQETTQRIVAKVDELYALPTDEEPTIAEVSDKEKIKEQPFFKNAENGDYILIYPEAKTAILYRESENKLINVGPIAISEGSQEGEETPGGTTEPQAPPEEAPAQ